jgi:hypothetical protein
MKFVCINIYHKYADKHLQVNIIKAKHILWNYF